MRVVRLWLEDFRCHASLEVALDAGVTVLTGANGCGKTSVLEAMAWLSTRRSFRNAPDASLVRAGAPHAIIRAEVEQQAASIPVLVEVQITVSGKNVIRLNRNVVRGSTSREAFPLSSVTFAPDDLELVQGPPTARREYLDDLVVEMAPRYGAVRRDLDRVLLQRGRLLRSGMRGADDLSTLDVWDAKLAETGAALVAGRLEALDRLAGPMAEAYGRIAGVTAHQGTVGVAYRSSWLEPRGGASGRAEVEALLAETLRHNRKADVDRQTTTAGPHRDDVALSVNELDARYQASQGEQRSLALALRLAAWSTIEERVGRAPLLLLDDVFSELDPGRAAALVANLPPAQTILTTAGSLPDGLDAGTWIPLDALARASSLTGPGAAGS